MVIRLQNLSVQTPVQTDARPVAELITLCEQCAPEAVNETEAELCRVWQADLLSLATDAWLIVSKQSQVVGYADVRQRYSGFTLEFHVIIFVHPDFGQRGIATLLLWLSEVRAHQMLQNIPIEQRATLRSAVGVEDEITRALFVHEGYEVVQRFWRLCVEMRHITQNSLHEWAQCGQIKVDVVVDTAYEQVHVPAAQQTRVQVARMYDVYEKILRLGQENKVKPSLHLQEVGV
ncbi:MAG TPA: GNAT family N-acetyltransferase [Dictyobacter sp.]|nr:GNAT family N-acetyltransferase [Dictyobacter sp.]